MPTDTPRIPRNKPDGAATGMGGTSKKRTSHHALWLANLLLVAGLLLLAFAATWLERIPVLSGPSVFRTVVSLLLALLPPLMWLLLFYRLDRAEPEPMEAIVKAALLGALVQQAVCAPLLSLFPFWATLSGWPQALSDAAGVLVISAIRIICLLLVLRWGVFSIASFNERTDGILYGSAIGLGFSAAVNVAWVLTSSGMLLSAAVPRMVVTSLIQASLGGLGGYWFGLSAFKRQPLWRLTLQLLILSGLGAVFQILPSAAARQGFLFRHLVVLLPSAVGALLIFLVLLLLLRRVPPVSQTHVPFGVTRQDSVLLVSVLLLALLAGTGLRGWQTRLLPVTPVPGIQVAVPANWQTMMNPEYLFSSGDRFSGGAQAGSLSVSLTEAEAINLEATQGEERIRRLAAGWTIRHARELSWWKPLSTEFLFRDGTWMAVVTALCLDDGAIADSGETSMLRQTRDILWESNGEVAHVTLHAANRDGTPDEKRMNELVAAIRFDGKATEGGAVP